MDLDFTDEQEMLREIVRGVCEQRRVARRRSATLEDDPIGYSTESLEAARPSSACSGSTLPERVRRLRA